MTRCTIKTADGELGTAELAAGVALPEVIRAMRDHRLFIVPEDRPAEVRLDAPEPAGTETVAPGGRARSSKGRRG